MAFLYITEFSLPAPQSLQAAQQPGVDQTPVAVGASAVSSAKFSSKTTLVRLHADTICSVSFGGAASVNSARMAAGQTEYFGVSGGQQVSVIANT